MTGSIRKVSPIIYANFAGLLYLLIAVSGGFSIGYVPSVIMAPGDAATTAQNMLDNQGLFRLGIFGDIIVLLLEIILTVLLYRLFKPVSQRISMIAAFSRLAMSVVMGINLLNYLIPLQLLSGADYLGVFEPQQLQALSLLFLEAHQDGIYIWGLFFGLHLFALGYLIFKSGYFPKILGLLTMIGSFGYSFESLAAFTLPNMEVVSLIINLLLVIAVIGELSFTFWLLIKGLNVEQWNRISLTK